MADKNALLSSVTAQWKELEQYIEGKDHRLRQLCFFGGVAVIASGLLSLIQLFNIVTKPIYYVVNVYQVFFGVITCLTEIDEQFLQGAYHTALPYQKWMHEWALGLTRLWGRALFYVFQGMLSITSCFNWLFGWAIGGYMIVMGAVCLSQHFKNSSSAHSSSLPDEFISIEN
mmetsp:Transcript_81032/g.127621  ORF Transcript_81032/g.127621 Transcript_81032/m.127621 type:complete len:172 (+) Transcript_81032:105-620(+)